MMTRDFSKMIEYDRCMHDSARKMSQDVGLRGNMKTEGCVVTIVLVEFALFCGTQVSAATAGN